MNIVLPNFIESQFNQSAVVRSATSWSAAVIGIFTIIVYIDLEYQFIGVGHPYILDL